MEDLIKRSDATEVVYKALKTPPLKGVLTDTMSLAAALVRDIPSADRPRAEWIWHEDEDICNCSRCDFEIDAEGCMDPTAYVDIYNYCPHCGARMKGADDEITTV